MKEASLPSPNIGPRGYHLRRLTAQAIGQIQAAAPHFTNGTHPAAAALKTFFLAAATAVDLYSSPSPTDGI